ncbi:MAG: hypothetical protein CL840_18910 [Crocinitomicaceae bacterium]|nr:hypothetical protein [Crocinitomicaceae bacterium]|tara:strand:+ start:4066 stop:4536 length:471 start_codon:yes stop_codon:yes gene_type:complete
MSKTRLLSILVGVLVVLNIIMMTWVMLGGKHHYKHPPRHKEGPKQMVIESLNFSTEQVKQYESAIKKHRAAVSDVDQKIRSKKNELYSLLKEPSAPEKDSIVEELTRLMIEMENIHYAHFEEIKSICEPNQLDEFNDLTEKLTRIFLPPKGRRGPR